MNHKQKRTRLKNTLRLILSMRPYSARMLGTLLCGLLKYLSAIGTAAVVSFMVALAMRGALGARVRPLAAILVGCILLRALSYYGEMFFGHDVAYKVLRDFRIKLYAKLECISPAYLLRRHSGQLGATLMGDVEVLEWFLAHTFGTMLVAIVTTGLLLFLLGKIHRVLMLLMLVFSILVLLTPFVLRKQADRQGYRMREALAQSNAVTIEGIQGLREILTLNYFERYQKKNRDTMQQLYSEQLAFGKRTGAETMMMQLLTGLFTVLIMLLTAGYIYQGVLDFAVYPVVVMLSGLLFSPITDVCGYARNLGNVFAAADRVQRVLDETPVVKDTGTEQDLHTLSPQIEFDHVSFRYDPELPEVLSDVSFTVAPGETVALVGHSGAGKSTCGNLLLRYWDPETGAVRIGGTDLRDMSIANLRALTAAVLQDVYLFNFSIRENIRLGRPDATDAEVEQAAKAAYAHDFIQHLPEKYDTVAGERGARLSGGQRQRIAIARAILKAPPILLLDEAVSNLDTENEYLIQKALREQAELRTTLIVAHRLSTILSADRVVFLEKGRVAGIGTHEALLRSNPKYRQLLQSQIMRGSDSEPSPDTAKVTRT